MNGPARTPGSRAVLSSTTAVAVTLAVVLVVALVAASCGGTGSAAPSTGQSATSSPGRQWLPADRTVAVITTGCGSASATVGSAVRLDAELVLTAAHVVAGAEGVAVLDGTELPAEREWPEFSPSMLFKTALEATIIAFDPDRDLAVISTGDPGRVPVERHLPEFGTVPVDTAIEIHGVTATEPVAGTVAERTTIVADEVRGGSRVERDGYRLEATTSGGDSGAGVWSADNRLVGLVFAVSSDDVTRTWAVSGREIEHFLDAVRRGPAQSFRCDDRDSRLVGKP